MNIPEKFCDNENYRRALQIMERLQALPAGIRIALDAVSDMLDPQVMGVLARRHTGWIPLHMIVYKLVSADRFRFWEQLFRNNSEHSGLIPRGELLSAWYHFHEDSNVCDPITASKASIMLIGNRSVALHCTVPVIAYPNIKRIMAFSRAVKLTLDNPMNRAIEADDAPSFEMYRLMSGRNLTYSLLVKLLKNKCVNIVKQLILDGSLEKNVMSLMDLCCFIAARFWDDVSVPMLFMVEEMKPGFIAGCKDNFGRNLLWCSVFNLKTAWFHPYCRLTHFLLEKGCDPENTDTIGVTWREVTENLTYKQKHRYLRERHYGKGLSQLQKNAAGIPLRQTLPLSALKEKCVWENRDL